VALPQSLENEALFLQVFAAEMSLAAGAMPLEGPLWERAEALPTSLRANMASLRAELTPLVGPVSSIAELSELVARAGVHCPDGWAMVHERVARHVAECRRSEEVCRAVAGAVRGPANMRAPARLLVLLERGESFTLCTVSPHDPALPGTLVASSLLTSFRQRDLTFAAALEPNLAAAALNILEVGPGDLLLDPCCGTGRYTYSLCRASRYAFRFQGPGFSARSCPRCSPC
jgi:hypothetical protein